MGTILLIGQHIAYSASPVMHAAAFRALGVSHEYRLADVAVDELPAVVSRLRDEDHIGANVTQPHKVECAAVSSKRAAKSLVKTKVFS